MKKFFATVMALVMVLSLAVTASAKVNPVTITRYGGFGESVYNRPAYITILRNNSPTANVENDCGIKTYEKAGWSYLARTSVKTPLGFEDEIIDFRNYAPFQIKNTIIGNIGNYTYPYKFEILAINGRPVQNYSVTSDDASKGGITLDKAQEYLNEIKETISDPQLAPRNAYNSSLPTGNHKMVSLYVNGLVAAYYTANSVKADFLSTRPVLKSGVVYVPLKDICSYLGATVKYDSKTQTTKVVQGNNIALIKTGSKTYILNGQKKTLEDAPYISDGSLMVPISFMTNIGYTVKTFNGKFGNKLKFDIYN